MTCNRCGKEMTKEANRGVSGQSDSWWCPFCGSTETIYYDKKNLPDDGAKTPRE